MGHFSLGTGPGSASLIDGEPIVTNQSETGTTRRFLLCLLLPFTVTRSVTVREM